MLSPTMFSSESSEHYTPRWLINTLGEFDLDPCSSPDKRVIAKRHCIGLNNEDGLRVVWFGRIFINPPYGKGLDKWVSKGLMFRKSSELIYLLPARTDTEWFHQLARAKPTILFFKGRLKFDTPNGSAKNSAPFPSMLVHVGKNKVEFIERVKHLGIVSEVI